MTAREQASSAEKTVLEFLEGRDAEILQFARDLIATPSPNPPGDGVCSFAAANRAACTFACTDRAASN